MIALFSDYFYGKVGTSQFAELACYAILRACCNRFFFIIEFKHIFRAEMHTDATTLAPVSVYPVFFQFLFCHALVPGFYRISNFEFRCLWFMVPGFW